MLTVNQTVKFRNIVDVGDRDVRMVVLELRGDRVLVGFTFPDFSQWTIPPTSVYLVSDLEAE